MKYIKTLPSLIAFVGFSLVSAPSAKARIGESITQIEERYGVPVGKTNVFPANHKEFQYKYKEFTIRVSFIDGVSVIEQYRKTDQQPLSPAEIEYLLAANLKDGKWTPNGSQGWTHDSEQARASYSQGDNSLTVIAKSWDDHLKHATEQGQKEQQREVQKRLEGF